MEFHGTFPFQVRSYEAAPDERAKLTTICDYLQEAAAMHADALGFSKIGMREHGVEIAWVLTRLRVKMQSFPRWPRPVDVLTWPHSVRNIAAYRDFKINSEGREFGVAASEWVMIGMNDRKLTTIPDFIRDRQDQELPPALGAKPFARFSYPAEPHDEITATFKALPSAIDMNGHVNNVQYLRWMLDTMPDGDKTPENGCDLELNFRNEVRLGDTVTCRACQHEGRWIFEVRRADTVCVVARLSLP